MSGAERFFAGIVQVTATEDRAANLGAAEALVVEAARRGAQAVYLPEMWPFIGDDVEKIRGAESLDGPLLALCARWAQAHGIWLFAGSVAEQGPDPGHVWNTSVVFAPDGARHGHYRKIHRFDIDIPGLVTAKESETVAAGDEAVVVNTPWAKVGLSICYDLRFPALFGALRVAGAEVLAVPAAFTAQTGKDHWEVLLRARAIETQCWVIAPNQVGRHSSTRQSHGHSMIIDPWGHVVARVGDGPGVAVAEIDLGRVRAVRRSLPCAEHRRPFRLPR